MYRIAHNLVIDHYRRRTQASYTALDDNPHLPAADGDPYQWTTTSLDSEALIRAIHELTEEQAQVIALRFFEGYSIAEVAALLDKSDGAIKALQYRAVASLRRIMSEQMI